MSIYDADTLTLSIDLGLGVSKTETVRLYGIDAPEIRGSSRTMGLEARDALRLLVGDSRLRTTTIKDKKDKYGRYLAVLWTLDGKNEPAININDWLVQNGYAVLRNY